MPELSAGVLGVCAGEAWRIELRALRKSVLGVCRGGLADRAASSPRECEMSV